MSLENLSKRERQIMDIILQKKEASVADVLSVIENAPSYSSIRALMNILKEKGYLKIKKRGKQYIYLPAISKNNAMKSALNNLLKTYFNNSVSDAVSALLEADKKLTDEEIKKIEELIDKSR